MSETVLIALITLASGLIGSSVGALSTYCVTKLTSSTAVSERLHTERYAVYTEFMNAYINFSSYLALRSTLSDVPDKTEVSLYDQCSAACTRASLLASRSTFEAINKLQLAMGIYGETNKFPDNINKLYSDTVDAMRKELLPKKKKSFIFRNIANECDNQHCKNNKRQHGNQK